MFIIFKQYSLINGSSAYLEQMQDRFLTRGSVNGDSFSNFVFIKFIEIKTLITNYITSFLPMFLLLLSFIYLVFTKAKLGLMFTKNGIRFLWLSTLPIVLLHFVFLNYSGHDFVSLYGSLFLSVVVGILYDKLKRAKTMSPYFLNGGILVSIFLSLAIYYFINKPGDYSWKRDYYAKSKEMGEFVKNNAKPEEIIYIADYINLDPQFIVYAERNIKRISHNENIIDSVLSMKPSVYFYEIDREFIKKRY